MSINQIRALNAGSIVVLTGLLGLAGMGCPRSGPPAADPNGQASSGVEPAASAGQVHPAESAGNQQNTRWPFGSAPDEYPRMDPALLSSNAERVTAQRQALAADRALRQEQAAKGLYGLVGDQVRTWTWAHRGQLWQSEADLARLEFIRPRPDLISSWTVRPIAVAGELATRLLAQAELRWEHVDGTAGEVRTLPIARPGRVDGDITKPKITPGLGFYSPTFIDGTDERAQHHRFNRMVAGGREQLTWEYVRPLTALEQMKQLLSTPSFRWQVLPDSLEALLELNQAELVNLRPAGPGAADLTLSWDGGQGYALDLKLPDGSLLQSVYWIHVAAGEQDPPAPKHTLGDTGMQAQFSRNFAVLRPRFEYDAQVGGTFTVLGAWQFEPES